MKPMIYAALIAVIAMPGASPSLAEVGVTDACQDEADELQDEIDKNEDDYTVESRRKAKNHLLAAKTNRMNPAIAGFSILYYVEKLEIQERQIFRPVSTYYDIEGQGAAKTPYAVLCGTKPHSKCPPVSEKA